MILQALVSYYERRTRSASSDIPPFGFSREKIRYALVLSTNGKLIQVKNLTENIEGRVVPKEMVVPQATKRAVNIEPNFCWDNTGYVLGKDNKGKDDRAIEAFQSFRELHQRIGQDLNDVGYHALLEFLGSWEPGKAGEVIDGLGSEGACWEDVTGQNVVFQIDGEMMYIHEKEEVRNAWVQYWWEKTSGITAECLVTHEYGDVERLHPSIKGVYGGHTAGSDLISFNLAAFESYGKEQSFNAPLSRRAAFSYATALNDLLRYGSRNRVVIADTSVVFWTERDSPVEGFLGIIFDPSEDGADDTLLRLFLESIRDGKMPDQYQSDGDMRFYILGLSPNAKRLAVRFWHVTTAENLFKCVGQHFNDFRIISQYEDSPECPGLWRLLVQTAVQEDSRNIVPHLATGVMHSILTGGPYPVNLLSAVLGRIRAGGDINYFRAGLIKAHLVRRARLFKQPTLEVGMALDRQSVNVAYRLGRLFAVLEKAQQDAVPGANATIKDRYYSAASATPRAVFPQLLRLAQHHIGKSDYGAVREREIGEIMDAVQEFPAHLPLEEQGLFAVGYYHQRQSFYTKAHKTKEVAS